MNRGDEILGEFVNRLEKWGLSTGVEVDQEQPNVFHLFGTTEALLKVHASAEWAWWGLMRSQLSHLQDRGREWFLVLLLGSPDTGYLVPSRGVVACTNSRTWPLASGRYHIHERTLGSQFYFRSFHEMANRLKR
jgi:hypothetical protein